MQVPILRGIYSDQGPDWRTGLPVNLVPVPVATGLSEGYLRPSEGIIEQSAGLGPHRGGIVWNGVLYRVIGEALYAINSAGSATVVGGVNASGRVQMDYGFEYLAIASGGGLWLYNGTSLDKVTDPDLGAVKGVIWIDGYFMTTDGEFLIVTELSNPFEVNPLKYGSSEADPDPIVALLKIRSEAYALNRHTIEVFGNVGGPAFPFQRIEGAQIQKGVVGPSACCVFADTLAFLGGGKNEAPSLYFGMNGQAERIASREIDLILSEYTEEELSTALLQERVYDGHLHLIVSLPRHTLVYDQAASALLQQRVWFQLSTSRDAMGPWLAEGIIRAYDRWNVCHPVTGAIGYLSGDVVTHWGLDVNWQFSTPLIYNEGRGAVVHEMELIALSGRADGTVATQYTSDGREWSQLRWANTSTRNARISWRGQGVLRNWRAQRFIGSGPVVPTRLEARLEPLAY